MKSLFLQLSAKALSMICLFLGTMSEVIAQYGAPSYFFNINGSVQDIECSQPVQNANVTLIDKETNQQYTAKTDSLGNFTITQETYDRGGQFIIQVNDTDGGANGKFLETSKNIEINNSRWYDRQTDSNRQVLSVAFISGSPCLVNDSLTQSEINFTPIIKSIISKPKQSHINQNEDTTDPENNESPLIPDPTIINSLLLYPNPNEGEFAIKFNLTQKGIINVSINSITGALIYTESFYAEAGEVFKQFGIAKPAPGTYYFHINTSTDVVIKPFIVE